jgi:RNA recognition motif. (a.k.a. RRM, RBD, or RNP domain)
VADLIDVYPLRLSWLFALPWGAERKLENILDTATSPHALRTNPLHILKSIPSKQPAAKTAVDAATAGLDGNSTAESDKPKDDTPEVFPRLKEGGAFVKVNLPAGESPNELESVLVQHLKSSALKPWWNPFERMRARLVKGKPWVEDLYRLPSQRLKVQFMPGEAGGSASELTQETLYEFFRPYGRLADITPQPIDSKELPKFAFVDFIRVRRAAMAKNCLHGVLIPETNGGGKGGTLLRIGYERTKKHNWIMDWLWSHPRIVIPIIAALVATITVAIFDP